MLGLSFSQRGQIYQQFLSQVKIATFWERAVLFANTTQGILFGLSVSFGVQPALAVIGQHFKKHRAMAMGLAAGGSSIGGVCLPIMFARMVPRIGFAWTIRLATLIFFCCFMGAMLLSRTKVPPSGSADVVRKPLRLGTLFDFAGYKDPRYLVLAIGCFTASLGLYVPYYYVGKWGIGDFPHRNIADSDVCRKLHPTSISRFIHPQLPSTSDQRPQLFRPHHGRLRCGQNRQTKPSLSDGLRLRSIQLGHVVAS